MPIHFAISSHPHTSIVKEFSSNSAVTFADVNLQEGQVSSDYQAGMGGWPTVRYFNAETGYKGAPYVQKTKGSMCDEYVSTCRDLDVSGACPTVPERFP